MALSAEEQRQAVKVLEHWGLLDLLEQQECPPRPKSLNANTIAKLLEDAKSRRASGNKREWHGARIYLGSVRRDVVARLFFDLFNGEYLDRSSSDGDFYVPIDKSRIALAALVFNENGDFSTSMISPLALLAGQKAEGKWRMSQNAAAELQDQRYKLEKDFFGQKPNARSIKSDRLEDYLDRVAGLYGHDRLERAAVEQLGSSGAKERKSWLDAAAAWVEPLNSNEAKQSKMGWQFYYRDLDLAAHIVTGESTGAFEHVARYALASLEREPSRKLDLLPRDASEAERDHLLSFYQTLLAPKNAPVGMWPSRFPPAFMQQVSINLAARLTTHGDDAPEPLPGELYSDIMTTNGPPGTGKTTLLQNVVANLVVKKARALSTVTEEGQHPGSAFREIGYSQPSSRASKYPRTDDGFPRAYHVFCDDSLNDYGALLCSANNLAVENVSEEWGTFKKLLGDLGLACSSEDPQEIIDAVLRRLGFDLDDKGIRSIFCLPGSDDLDLFFTEIANNGSAADTKANADSLKWGLIGAKLGKDGNVRGFLENHLAPLCRLHDRAGSEEPKRFKASVEQFNKCYADIRDKQKLLSNDYDAIVAERADTVEAARKQLERSYRKKEQGLEKLNRILGCTNSENFETVDEQARKLQSQLLREREAIEREHEGLLGRLANSKHQKLERFDCDTEKGIALHILNEELPAIEKAYREWKAARERVASSMSKLDEARQQQANSSACIRELGSAPQRMDRELLDDLLGEEQGPRAQAHTANPSSIEGEFNGLDRERQRLFVLALQIIKHFFLCSNAMCENFDLLHCFRTGKFIKDGTNKESRWTPALFKRRQESLLPAFQSLFFLMPIVSSTFASVNSLFDNSDDGKWKLDEPPFGLLIVDEAGQAVPQAAVGALMRCRRAMIVGDPLQVEPVRTSGLDTVSAALAGAADLALVNEGSSSVQTVADAQNPYGSHIGDKWVGCPLLVHRRCIDPMFSISNRLSYDGLMMNETKSVQKKGYLEAHSAWMNVKGPVSGEATQEVREQTELTLRLIERHLDKLEQLEENEPKPTLYVISPFSRCASAIQEKCKERGDRYRDFWAPDKKEDKTSCVGTVHKFQGREADEVVLVLGCDHSKIGSANWVEENKSIINVAVTRAKQRLYVVGDADVWRRTRNRAVVEHVFMPLAQAVEQLGPTDEASRLHGLLVDASKELEEPKSGIPTNDEKGRDALSASMLNESFGAVLEKLDLTWMRKHTPFRTAGDIKKHFSLCEEQHGDPQKKENPALDNFVLAMHYREIMEKAQDKKSISETYIAKTALAPLDTAAELYLKHSYLNALKLALPKGMEKYRTDPQAKKGRLLTLGSFSSDTNSLLKKSNGPALEQLAQAVGRQVGADTSKYSAEWWYALGQDIRSYCPIRNNEAHEGRASYAQYTQAFETLLEGGELKKLGGPGLLIESRLPKLINRACGTLEQQGWRPGDGIPDVIDKEDCEEKGVLVISKLLSQLKSDGKLSADLKSSEANQKLIETGLLKDERPRLPTDEGHKIGIVTIRYPEYKVAGYPKGREELIEKVTEILNRPDN